ncbi:hypothetical protein DMH12_31690 [Streptomyces sp. WAC 04229]|uniref:AfsR/SARP family transcriptional regulator n=1 Tax=Streptomyces sp. WAC 04229 TaxID=2203206 RepID=UPI000F739732|nr:AfsR/SARP family transcriptional regulator [Streptomyces sp. WAC 04229]RSN44296.1 hypothetical protein DMH12_31690 [Streptomyces sp. WAC 04229]
MEFRLLGPVEASDEGRRVALAGSKVHTVLAALLLARGRVVSDERLSDLLWGWDPPATRNAQLYTYTSRLRKSLGPDADVVRRQPGYQLAAPGAGVDLFEFERLDRSGRTALEERRFEDAADSLRRALELWQGPALSNVTEHLAEAELPRLEEARTNALERRLEADLALGRHQEVMSELTGLVNEFPVRELLRAQLMTALYRCGRQAEALGVFHEGRKVLAEELGVDPGTDLTATYQAVLSGELTLLPRPATSTVRATVRVRPPVTLPPPSADFTGRREEFAELCAHLRPPRGRRGAFRSRRMLIAGMAGVGKTALAVEVAHAVAAEFPEGQLHVPLRHADGRVKDLATVLSQLLRALGEPGTEGPAVPDDASHPLDDLIHRYRTRTAGRRLLILLDDAAGELRLDALLPATADSAVIVTSRSRLTAVPGSRTVVVEPLDTADSYALLAAIAGRKRVEHEPEAARGIVDACAGLPLALRTAATRLAARPHWPAARLARRLADPALRLAELRAGDLDTGRTLLTALDSRPEAEREAARELAPDAHGTVTAADAAGVLGLAEEAAEELLERLVEETVLEMAGIDAAGRPHYRFHELMRLVAAGPLGCRGGLTLSRAS